MAVRPWENRFLDINLKEGVMVHEDESSEKMNGTKISQFKSTGKKDSGSNLHLNLSNPKMAPSSQSDGCECSPSNPTIVLDASNTLPAKPKIKLSPENVVEQDKSRHVIGSRSHSNPKERSSAPAKLAKKRLSLPNSGNFAFCLCVCVCVCLPSFNFQVCGVGIYHCWCRFFKTDQLRWEKSLFLLAFV